MNFDNSWKPEETKPTKYVLVDMRIIYDKSGRESVVPGWWNGMYWEGARITRSDKVLEWKREYGG